MTDDEDYQVSSELYEEFDYSSNCKPTVNQKYAVSKFKFSYPPGPPETDSDGDLVVTRKPQKTDMEVIEIEHSKSTVLDLVGLQVWRGALLLGDWLLHHGNQLKNTDFLIELGSGVGLSSIVAAMYTNVICTDIDKGGLLKLISCNISRNKHLTKHPVKVLELDFMSPKLPKEILDVLPQTPIVIAADVVYDDSITDAFLQTVQKILAEPPARSVYVALEKRLGTLTTVLLSSVRKCKRVKKYQNMACSLFTQNFNQKLINSLITQVRHGHHLRGKPPGIARTLQQRLDELNYKDPTLTFKVDIGLPPPQISRSKQLQERIKHLEKQRKNPELEKLSRQKKLVIDLETVNQEWLETVGPDHIKTVAEHYGVFNDLFGDAYFLPFVNLHVNFIDKDVAHPVYYGNIVKPRLTKLKPEISYKADEKSFYTLVLTNPDGNFEKQDSEYVHWLIGNIPGNNTEKGETVVDYLQSFPPKGTGYHRHVFVLYKQEKKLDFTKYKKSGPCLNLSDRNFSTLEFYRELQNDMTPVGLAFYQSDWDDSLTEFYHKTLGMKEPIFEYDFPEPYIRKQEWFPVRRPFNLYMDKYRDPKQINKEFLERKLKNVNPFERSRPPLKFPNAVYFEKYTPSWLKLEIRKSRMKWGRINDIE